MLRRMFSQVLDRRLTQGVRVVIVRTFRLNQSLFTHQAPRLEIAGCPPQRSVKPIEPSPQRPTAMGLAKIAVTGDVPLPAHVGAVAGCLEHLGQSDRAFAEITAITGATLIDDIHPPHPGLVRIETGQEARPCWRAPRGGVELGETETVGG